MNETSEQVSVQELREPRVSNLDYDRLARVALLAIIAVVCAITWRKWGSLIIDCGREMYVPAALSGGKRLYFDVWYPYGPLIPYWHALLFRVFGIHLWILQTAGIAVASITAVAAYSLSRLFLPVALSFVAGFAVILQSFQLNLFNYIQPYSYPAAYGAMILVVLALLLVKDCFREKPWTMLAAGLIAGVEAITKTEFGLAAYVLLGVAILLRALRSRSLPRMAKDAALCAPGLLLGAGVYGWYVRASSIEFMFGQNIPLLPGSYFVKAFGGLWLTVIGFTLSPHTNAKRAITGLLGLAAVAAGLRVAGISRAARWLLGVGALSICALHLTQSLLHWKLPSLLAQAAPFLYFNKGMVFVAGALLVPTLIQWWKHGRGTRESALLVLLAAALAAGSRTLTRIQPTGYPIFYDTLAFVASLIALRQLASFIRVPDCKRLWGWTSAVLCCGIASLAAVYYPVQRHSFPISTARGSLYTDPSTGEAFAGALAFLNEAAAHSEKFVVWPEEAAFYYFTGTVAPSRWYVLAPGILPPGELTSGFLDELDRQHVKYVALSNRSSPEYKVPIFGVDYNQQVYGWLTRNFRLIRTFGDFQRVAFPPHWAIQIWERQPVAGGRQLAKSDSADSVNIGGAGEVAIRGSKETVGSQ
jgi:hypothetical protein